MFEEQRLAGLGDKSICVETRLRTRIDNVITPEADKKARLYYQRVKNKFGKQWVNRKPATGGYNCFGMLFASRRTFITDEGEGDVECILKEDGYRQLSDQNEVVTGDIVLYREKTTRSIYHVCVVTHVASLQLLHGDRSSNTRGGIIYALSKWSGECGEDEHHVEHHCWKECDVEMEYWTDRL